MMRREIRETWIPASDMVLTVRGVTATGTEHMRLAREARERAEFAAKPKGKKRAKK